MSQKSPFHVCEPQNLKLTDHDQGKTGGELPRQRHGSPLGDAGIPVTSAKGHSQESSQYVRQPAQSPVPVVRLQRNSNLTPTSTSTSTFGSITEARFSAAALCPAYKVSKSAVNSLTVQYAIDHEKEGFSFIALCPGVRFLFFFSFFSSSFSSILPLPAKIVQNFRLTRVPKTSGSRPSWEAATMRT